MIKFDFSLLENKSFDEASVREFIIAPLLKELGFVRKNDKKPQKLEILLSQRQKTDFKIGSNKTTQANLIPDYTLYVDSKIHCVLDAKAPKINIEKDSEAFKQALSYAIGFKTSYFALCNGYKMMIFHIDGQKLLLEVDLEKELKAKLNTLKKYLTKTQDLKLPPIKEKKDDSWYLSRELPKAILNPQKRTKARYFGCTAYFTRQSWDIVTQNIKNFTTEGDVVLDSFGGSGVSAIEAMMNGRLGIHTDLNPLSIFMVKALSAKVNLGELYDTSEEILSEFELLRPKNEKEAKVLLKGAKYYPNAMDKEFGELATQKEQEEILWIPKDELLPKGSDVESVLKLFSSMQLAELALLRKLIFKKTFYKKVQKEMRYSLMLAFYNTITRCNLTFHYADSVKTAGDSGIYKYYRYRIAPKPAFLDIGEHFRGKIERVKKGKEELENSPLFYDSYFYPMQGVIKDFEGSMLNGRKNLDKSDALLEKINGEKIFQADATNLKEIENESIDFIYTDPPYGAKIPYLDLSTMWNAWLDLSVNEDLKQKECIEKGSLEKTRYEYYDLMKKSLQEMYRILKFNRWLAFVFQHQDPKLWQILVDSAENVGFEYVGSVSQENTGIASFKKVQNPTSVLKGQIIIYFKKIDNAKIRAKLEAGIDVMEEMFKDIEEIIVENSGASLEEIWNSLIIKAMNNGYLHIIGNKFENFIPAINERFDCDENKKYHLRENTSFTNYAIPIEKRVEYLVKSALDRAKKENKGLKFDEIVLYVIPLSKNGVQANNKMIKEILNEIAVENKKTGEYRIKDKKDKEPSLFEDLE